MGNIETAATVELQRKIRALIDTLPTEAEFWAYVLDQDAVSTAAIGELDIRGKTHYLFRDNTGMYEKRPGDWYILTPKSNRRAA